MTQTTRNNRTYTNIHVTNMTGTIAGYIKAEAVEERGVTMRLRGVTMDAAAVAVVTGYTIGERERLRATDSPLPYFQMNATEERPGGAEVASFRLSLKKLELEPANEDGWWRATHEVRATIY